MSEEVVNVARLQKEIGYYKKRSDELTGANVKLEMEVANLRHELKQKKQGFALLSELQQSIEAHKDTKDIFRVTVEAVTRQLGMDKTMILVPTDAPSMFKPSHWLGYTDEQSTQLASTSIDFPEDFLKGNSVLVANKSTEKTPLIDLIQTQLNLPFFVCVLVSVEQAPLGILISGRLKEAIPIYPPFDQGDIDTFQSIGGLITASVQNMRMAVLKETDRYRRDIQNLLDNLSQSVFAVSAEGSVVPPVSKYTQNIFGDAFIGRNIYETVFKDINPSSESYSMLKTALGVVFGESELQWDILSDQLVDQIPYSERTLKLAYKPLWDSNGLLEKLMFVVEDITDLIQLEKKVAAEKVQSARNIQIIQEMASVESAELKDYFTSAYKLVSESKDLIKALQPSGENIGETLRNLHTLKGNSRIFNFSFISSLVHHIENEVIAYRERLLKGELELQLAKKSILALLLDVQSLVLEYAKLAQRVFRMENQFESNLLSEVHRIGIELDYLLANPPQRTSHALQQLIQTLPPIAQSLSAPALEQSARALDGTREKWLDLSKQIREITIKSNILHSLPTHAATWEPLVAGTFECWRLFEKIAVARSQKETIAFCEKAHSLKAYSLKNEMIYLSSLFRALSERVDEKVTLSESDLSDIRRILIQAIRFISLACQLNSDEVLSSKIKAELAQSILQSSESNLDDRSKLSETSSKDSVLITSLESLATQGVRPIEFFESLGRALGIPNRALTLDRWLGNYERDGKISEEIDLSQIREAALEGGLGGQLSTYLSGYAGHPLAQSMEDSFKPDNGHSPFFQHSLEIDFIRLLEGFVQEPALVKKRQTSKMHEISDVGLSNLRRVVLELQGELKDPKLAKLLPNLKEAVGRLTESPVKPSLFKFIPMVREISKRLGKKVQLKITGDEATLEREALHLLTDALVHMVRNSIDHAIEPPDLRRAAGKPEMGTIELECRETCAGVSIYVRDDGKGIDADKVCAAAIAARRITAEAALRMSLQDKVQLIFLPSFSTKSKVDDLSGRGVGMDVVQANIQRLGGSLGISTHLGKGTEFHIQVMRNPEL